MPLLPAMNFSFGRQVASHNVLSDVRMVPIARAVTAKVKSEQTRTTVSRHAKMLQYAPLAGLVKLRRGSEVVAGSRLRTKRYRSSVWPER